MKNQFEIIQPWIPIVLAAIKKDLKTSHLPTHPLFVRTHFGKKPLTRLTTEEIFAAYEKDLLTGDIELGEWVVHHWVFQHGDVYAYFAEALSLIEKDYNAIESLTEAQSEEVLHNLPKNFSALTTYLFCILNRVVFPPSILHRLRAAAETEEATKKREEKQQEAQQSYEQLKEHYARDIARLQEKYENKVAGVLKKYTVEMEALKKQIRSLQKQLETK